MGYNATDIITRFVEYAGSADDYVRGPSGRLRLRFPDGSGSSLYYRRDRQGRVIAIVSYGDHFPLARLMLHPSGKRKMWLLNGDRWPGGGFGRTNEHNDIARSAVQATGDAWFIVPFSALTEAGIELESVTPVQVNPESWTWEPHTAATLDKVPENVRKRGVWRDATGAEITPPANNYPGAGSSREGWPDGEGGWYVQERKLGDKGYAWYKVSLDGPAYEGELIHSYEDIEPEADGLYHYQTERHWLGTSLFRARYNLGSRYVGEGDSRRWLPRNRWAYFVTAFDYNEPWPLWFMSELRHGVAPATVDEAIGTLKPEEVRQAEAAGIPVLRQGDVYVIQAPLVAAGDKGERDLIRAGGELVAQDWSWGRHGGRYVNDSHTVTRVVRLDGRLFVRGIMRHAPARRRPDHARLDLWDRQTWGEIVFNAQARGINAQPRSWGHGGNVD
jgi:hypothetical protein